LTLPAHGQSPLDIARRRVFLCKHGALAVLAQKLQALAQLVAAVAVVVRILSCISHCPHLVRLKQ
jgi:hypothetical protein